MSPTLPEKPTHRSQAAVRLWFGVLRQARTLRATLLLAYLSALLGLCVLAWISSTIGVPVSDFTRDPVAVMRAPFYTGLLSNLGILLWCATAAITLFGAAVLDKRGQRREWVLFLRWSGLVTTVLLFDDLFLFHERVFPEFLNIREGYVLLCYGLLMLVYLGIFHREILQTEFLALVLAGGFFAGSILVDRLPENWMPWHHLVEDGSKFLGIVTWFLYFSRTTTSLIRRATDVG